MWLDKANSWSLLSNYQHVQLYKISETATKPIRAVPLETFLLALSSPKSSPQNTLYICSHCVGLCVTSMSFVKSAFHAV